MFRVVRRALATEATGGRVEMVCRALYDVIAKRGPLPYRRLWEIVAYEKVADPTGPLARIASGRMLKYLLEELKRSNQVTVVKSEPANDAAGFVYRTVSSIQHPSESGHPHHKLP
ncbi:GPI transamidase subunit PIG-U [Plasmodiophora brassicae]